MSTGSPLIGGSPLPKVLPGVGKVNYAVPEPGKQAIKPGDKAPQTQTLTLDGNGSFNIHLSAKAYQFAGIPSGQSAPAAVWVTLDTGEQIFLYLGQGWRQDVYSRIRTITSWAGATDAGKVLYFTYGDVIATPSLPPVTISGTITVTGDVVVTNTVTVTGTVDVGNTVSDNLAEIAGSAINQTNFADPFDGPGLPTLEAFNDPNGSGGSWLGARGQHVIGIGNVLVDAQYVAGHNLQAQTGVNAVSEFNTQGIAVLKITVTTLGTTAGTVMDSNGNALAWVDVSGMTGTGIPANAPVGSVYTFPLNGCELVNITPGTNGVVTVDAGTAPMTVGGSPLSTIAAPATEGPFKGLTPTVASFNLNSGTKVVAVPAATGKRVYVAGYSLSCNVSSGGDDVVAFQDGSGGTVLMEFAGFNYQSNVTSPPTTTAVPYVIPPTTAGNALELQNTGTAQSSIMYVTVIAYQL